ncbi:MAG: DUF1926 domain-containing protein [Chitinivibrionales bacterium]|nr:DUF1926 domain-containing protein [Chitinivibrionales bacterium]
MKRNAIAFLVHPYKNSLLPRNKVKAALSDFTVKFVELARHHHNIKWNVQLPGYLLECIDPLALASLRELNKNGAIEWLSTGYTEPFLSFSPHWLTKENIKYGIERFDELVGTRPVGFMPSFSNWEPSFNSFLGELGLHYVAFSKALFPRESHTIPGYFTTEHAGSSMVIFPLNVFHVLDVPRNFAGWLERAFGSLSADADNTKLVCIDFLLPFLDQQHDPFEQISQIAAIFDKLLLKYQFVHFSEFLSVNASSGLQYIPSGLVFKRHDQTTVPYFLNYLHTFDQVGILQRKMMDISSGIEHNGGTKHTELLKRSLFFVQDINRFLPGMADGFPQPADRTWSYGQLIDIEKHLSKKADHRGGRARISDFLKSGSKCVILSNRQLKVYVDHKNGGHAFEMDFRPCNFNICSAYRDEKLTIPHIILPGVSRSGFVDHIVADNQKPEDLQAALLNDIGDFAHKPFTYKIKKTASKVRVTLIRHGSLLHERRKHPLNLEKAFGLDGDEGTFTFAYQLSSHSFLKYAFRLAIECTFLFPGALIGNAMLSADKEKCLDLSASGFFKSSVTDILFKDRSLGCQMSISTQKPVDIVCSPLHDGNGVYQGTTVILSCPVVLKENNSWSLLGKLTFKKIRRKGKPLDEI